MENHFTQAQHGWVFKAQLPHCQIWEHAIDHTLVEAYPVDNYERIHARINRNREHLVNVLGCANDAATRRSYLLVERIPNRLSEVLTLNEAQTLKVLYSTFRGLEQLQDIYGCVGLNQACICFNLAGKVKVWVSPDLSSVHPIMLLPNNSEERIPQVIAQTVQMVQRKCFNTSLLKALMRKVSEGRIKSYGQAALQIMKIGELLFVSFEEKNLHRFQKYRDITANEVERIRTQQENKIGNKQQSKVYANNQQNNVQAKKPNLHKRHQSFTTFNNTNFGQDDKCKKLKINLTEQTKYSQSQAQHNETHYVRQPLTPKEPSLKPELKAASRTSNQSSGKLFWKKQSLNIPGNIQSMPASLTHNQSMERLVSSTHKPPIMSSFYHSSPIREDAQDNIVDEDEVTIESQGKYITGEFKTFGMLDDAVEKKTLSKASRSSRDNRKGNTKRDSKGGSSHKMSDFDVEEMEKQIERKLSLKHQKNRHRTASIVIVDEPQTPKPSPPPSRTPPKPSTLSSNHSPKPSALSSHHSPPSRSPAPRAANLTYIDQKYTQYIQSPSGATRNLHLTAQKENQRHNHTISSVAGTHKHGRNYSNVEAHAMQVYGRDRYDRNGAPGRVSYRWG